MGSWEPESHNSVVVERMMAVAEIELKADQMAEDRCWSTLADHTGLVAEEGIEEPTRIC